MKKTTIRSALAVLLAASTLTACGGSAASSAPASAAASSTAVAPAKQYTIGIAEAQANDETTVRRAYLENYIGPAYNVKFIFSETLKDDAATKTFIENCIDSGADAIIDMKSASGQMAQLCMDNGLVYTINGNYTQHPELLTTDYTNFAGCIGANNAQIGSLFGDWLEENASEDGSEGFLISTSLAAQGNTQHVEITRAILEGLQQKYGITYTKSIDDLIASSETTNVENDKNILITLYPGSPNKDTWLPGISTLLQTGNYKMFLSSGQTYNQSATVVDEVEKSFGINIKVASVGALGTTLETAFNTKDSSGNSSVDLVAIKAVSTQTAAMFAATYNALVSGAECRACRGEDGLPVAESLRALFDQVTALIRRGEIVSAQALGMGGAAEAVFKMGLGNRVGFAFDEGAKDLFKRCYGGFVVEYAAGAKAEHLLGRTTEDYALTYRGERVDCAELENIYDAKLEDVFPVRAAQGGEKVEAFRSERTAPAKACVKIARPRVLIPVFPGTNCEYDTERAFQLAGAETQTIVVRNLSAKDVQESVEAFAQSLKQAQIVFIPGGFSGGDEPDGSGKFITAFFRNPAIREGVMELLKGRDGLMGGICNGFQALIKLGLVPYGEIREPDAGAPTLTFNVIGRHQSRIVRTRVASTLSPWLMHARVGDVHIAPISHGEGRFIADMETVRALAKAGQIATQYVNAAGEPTMDIDANPNGSVCAIEGITSPDGRVFGRMAHAERTGAQLYRNVPGNQDSGIFRGAVDYFRD